MDAGKFGNEINFLFWLLIHDILRLKINKLENIQNDPFWWDSNASGLVVYHCNRVHTLSRILDRLRYYHIVLSFLWS